MAGKGIYSYTVQEGTNAGLGQGGSMLLTGSTTYNAPTGQVFVSITFLTNSIFGTLTAEDPDLYINTAQATLGGTVVDTETFPQGVTIYGRWNAIQLSSSNIAIAYTG